MPQDFDFSSSEAESSILELIAAARNALAEMNGPLDDMEQVEALDRLGKALEPFDSIEL